MIFYKLTISNKLFYQLAPSMILLCITIIILAACSGGTPLEPLRPDEMKGPLRVSQSNPLYFTDGSGKAIYLSGSHNWCNLVDCGTSDPPPAFDFTGYLNMLSQKNHNFIRLWARELLGERKSSSDPFGTSAPFPWPRSGPGTAIDGKPKFNLSQFNQAYFDRLRSRVIQAHDRGIYVSIMLFEGWGIMNVPTPLGWEEHPFNKDNNANGIDGDPNRDWKGLESHTLQISAIVSIQEAYVKKVIDTVNDLDNVLYEISNEDHTGSVAWQYHMIDLIHQYEKTKAKQHPVGMTICDSDNRNNAVVFNSPADWISPAYTPDFYAPDPPAADGKKVILLDTDHIWGIGGDRTWVWKSFLRGYNPIYMDRFDTSYWEQAKGRWDPEDARKAMGHTLTYATKMNLASMAPHPELSSTTYCLANPGSEYLIYKPKRRNPLKFVFTLNLKAGTYRHEWFNPRRGVVVSTGSFTVEEGEKFFIPPFSFIIFNKSFIPPFIFDDAVLYIYSDKV